VVDYDSTSVIVGFTFTNGSRRPHGARSAQPIVGTCRISQLVFASKVRGDVLGTGKVGLAPESSQRPGLGILLRKRKGVTMRTRRLGFGRKEQEFLVVLLLR